MKKIMLIWPSHRHKPQVSPKAVKGHRSRIRRSANNTKITVQPETLNCGAVVRTESHPPQEMPWHG